MFTHAPIYTCIGDTLDEWLNILQSIQLPFALLPVLYFTSDEKIMVSWCVFVCFFAV